MYYEHTLIPNEFLRQTIKAYYSVDYVGYGNPGNPDYINILKNDFNKEPENHIYFAAGIVVEVSKETIKDIIVNNDIDIVCIVPRAKKQTCYKDNQLFFRAAIGAIIEDDRYDSSFNGLDFIQRHTNTKTTHFHNKPEYSGDGELPYPGITKDTCHISDKIKGKNILLIDDIYTKTINIDEDCIQALLDNGAKNVVLYTVAKTAKKY